MEIGKPISLNFITLNISFSMAPAVGLEPTPTVLDAVTLVLKTSVLPLHYADVYLQLKPQH